jgi:hypothetical protein
VGRKAASILTLPIERRPAARQSWKRCSLGRPVYFLEGNNLALVHYCSAGNQPKMKLETPRDSNVLSFRCLGGTNMTEQDSHMHWARLELVDVDHLKGSWNSMKGDKVEWVAEAELIRQK